MDLDEIEDDGVHGGRMRPLASLNANTFVGKRHLYAAAAMAPCLKVKRIAKAGYGSQDNAHLSNAEMCQANALFENAAARSPTLFPKMAGLKRTISNTRSMLQGPNICKHNIVAETKARKNQRTSKVLAKDITVENMKTLNGSKGNLELLLMALDSCSDVSASNVTLCRKDKRKLEQRDQAFERVSKRTKSSSCLSEVSPKRKSDPSIGGKIDKETRSEPSDHELAPSDAHIYPSSMYQSVALKELCLFDSGLSQSSNSKENQTNCKQPSTSLHNSMTKDQNLDSMEVPTMGDQSKISLTLSIGGDNLRHRRAPKPVQKTLMSNLISETDLILAVFPGKVVEQHSATTTTNLPNVSLREQKDVGSAEEIRADFSQAPSDVNSPIRKCLSLFPVETEILISDQKKEINSIILQQGLKKKVSNPNPGALFKPGIIKKPRDRKQVQACLEAILATVGKKDLDASIEMRKKEVREPIANLSSFEFCKSFRDDARTCINGADEMQHCKKKILECNIDKEENHPKSPKLGHGQCGFIQTISCSQTVAIASNAINVSMEFQETTRKDATQLKICKQKKINAEPESCRFSIFPDAAARRQASGDHIYSDRGGYHTKICTSMPDKAIKRNPGHEVPNDRQIHMDGVSRTCAQQNFIQAEQFSDNAIAGRGSPKELLPCVQMGTDDMLNGDPTSFPSLIDLLPRCTHSMSAKDPAGFAARWLELLRLDIKGRLSALKRSKQRVRATVVSRQVGSETVRLSLQHTQDTTAKHAHLCCKQQTGPFSCNLGKICNKQEQELQTLQHWSSLFTGMDIALSLEKEKLESWLKSIQHVKAKCRTLECQEKQKTAKLTLAAEKVECFEIESGYG